MAGCFTIVATVTSFWLVNKHLQWYTNVRTPEFDMTQLTLIYASLETRAALYVRRACSNVVSTHQVSARYRAIAFHGSALCLH